MRRPFKDTIVSVGLIVTNKTVFNVVAIVAFVSITIMYFIVDRDKLVQLAVSFAINQVLLLVMFGAGTIASINIYLAKKHPLIIDEILLRTNKDLFLYDSYIFQVLENWHTELIQKPIGFDTIGKEMLIKYFINAEIKYIEYNLAVLIEDMFSDLNDPKYATSQTICDQFKHTFINQRLDLSRRFGDVFLNRLTIDSKINLPIGRKKEVMRLLPNVIFDKYIDSCADFNVFLGNCITQIARENKNRFDTLKMLYSDLVKCIYSYKDNLPSNFKKEFNGDLAKYHLLYDGCILSKSHSKHRH